MTGAAVPGFRFDRSARLRSRRDFDEVFSGGVKVVNRQLVARLRPAPGGRSRLGLSVSRKVGNAPRRNRVKRCLRAAFRELAPRLPEPLEIVLIARPLSAPDSYEVARKALADVFARHGRGATAEDRPRPGRRRGKGRSRSERKGGGGAGGGGPAPTGRPERPAS